ncbi:MAG: glycosyltransferase [Cytophagaceae bacterium]|nr:glycosyltransferase [Cytophagaceae bacterium]
MQPSLVSVICLCYNQAPYVAEAIASVAWQTYSPVECIVINDASSDNSREVLDELQHQYPWLQVVHHATNQGMCASFNEGMRRSKGDFLIDLAADDVMHPERIALQVLRANETRAGVVYSDAWIMDQKGMVYNRFYTPTQVTSLPEGDLFSRLLRGYFICSPTILIRKSLMLELGGYDASLVYEDYDFFIRSSRDSTYAVVPEPLTYRREVPGSNSSRWYLPFENPHLHSTLQILQATFPKLRNEEERQAFHHSLRYHWRQSIWLQVKSTEAGYWVLMKQTGAINFSSRMWKAFSALPLPWHRAYLYFRSWRDKMKKALQKRAFSVHYKYEK